MSEASLRNYVTTLVVLAAVLAASWIYWHGVDSDLRLIIGAVVFAGLMLVGVMFSIQVDEHTTIGTWDIAMIGAVVVLGPTWAAVAAVPSAIFVGRGDWSRTVYEVGSGIIIVYLSGTVFSFTSAPLLSGGSESLANILYGTLVAGMTLVVTNEVISGVLLKVKYGQPFSETWKEVTQPYLVSDAIVVLTAGLGVVALELQGPIAAVITVAGAVGSQALVYRSRAQVKEIGALRERVCSLEEALATSNMSFGAMMIEDLGRKDGYTHRHAAATAAYAQDLAREMKLDSVKAGRLRMAGLLHNIGLFGMPDELLLSTGKPNSVAQNLLSEHPERGEAALAAVPEFKDISSWVRWHHERPDGRGYPDKLRGAWTPLEAKILAVAQAYASMVLDKPQHPGLSFAEAREKLSSGSDTEFDGLTVRAFLRILDTENEGYRLADDGRFVFPSYKNGNLPDDASISGAGQ